MDDRRTLLCVHPHPDDESIACGGVLARAADLGARTVVVTCTGGEEGENQAGIVLDTDMRTQRRGELAEALRRLGVDEHVTLDYRDSGMAGTPANDHPDSFLRADTGEAARRLAAVIRRVRPDVVVSDDEHGGYGHPDHIKAHEVTVRAVALAADPDADLDGEVWRTRKRYVITMGRRRIARLHGLLLERGLTSPFGDAPINDLAELPLGTPDERVTTEVDVTAWLDAKRHALRAHESQLGPDSFFLNIPDDLATEVFGVEQFILEDGTPGTFDGEVEDDLFGGLPVASAVPAAPAVPDAAAVADVDDRVTPDRFRGVLARFASGIGVMTTVVDGEPHAMTASSIASVSLDPPLVLVCVGRTAVMAEQVVAGGVFALSFLAADQAALSVHFSNPARPVGAAQLDGVAHHTAVTGAPVLDGAVGWVDTRVWAVHDGGDHLIVVGRVVDLGTDPDRAPLLHHQRDYHVLGPVVVPGTPGPGA